MPCRATQDGQVMVESSDITCSRRKRNGKPLQYSCLENPMNSMKSKKDRIVKHELPRSVQFSSVQSLSRVWLFVAPRTAARQASLSITISRSCSDSCPLSQWCHPAISSSIVPFSSCPQSLPASKSSPMSQLFTWGGQSIGLSALASVLPVNTQDWSPLGWTG